ncbi:DUF6443 domain-containing protein, partial [Flavobacterium sp. KMS]|uniref:DUF6443 domain-containing protein n=1 Tax=Flavobacterium sp. KMS TaxID=1566023 RepID=UPI00103DCE2F
MYINKYLIAFVFTLFSLFAFSQQEESLGDKKQGTQLNGQPTLRVVDSKFADLSKQNVFTSINPVVSIYFGFNDKLSDLAYSSVYYSEITLRIIPFDDAGNILTSYKDNKNVQKTYPNPFLVTLKIKHDNVTKGARLDDYAVYQLPGIHKADVKVESIKYYDSNNVVTTVSNSSAYLELKFNTDRYYNMQLSATQFTSVLPITRKFVKYYGTKEVEVYKASDGAEELVINWVEDKNAPAVEYEVEWTWIDNYKKEGGKLATNEIALTEQDFKLNSTRIETKNTSYRIPLVYSKGYLVYRIRPIGRFLDDTSKNFYGTWSSGLTGSFMLISDWPHIIEIDQAHELGKKNWQYQSSFAEEGKKKEVVSYFDGSLRNRQTVTKINSDNKTIVGEVIYDNQGRAAIEVLPAPIEASGIHFYDRLTLNSKNILYTHNDFDWDNPTVLDCAPVSVSSMSNVAGASKYYSENNLQWGNYQDFVPDAKGYPFSQIEYTPDNTGRIKRKGGVGLDHQIGKGHEMQYFYGQPKQEELNRLFGYKVGDFSHYKKNTVIDPNGQISVSYIDPQGRTIATALVGDNNGNLLSLNDETDSTLHLTTTTNLLSNNDKYASGSSGIYEDGMRLNTPVSVIKEGEIKIEYTLNKTVSSYTDDCLNGKQYPFVYDWSIGMKNDCADELLIGTDLLSSKIGVSNLNSFSTSPLKIKKEYKGQFQGKFLKVGTYPLSKDIHVNQDVLNEYADDYIAELIKNKKCLPDLVSLEADVTIEDCNVTCKSCEQSLVCENLTIAECEAFNLKFSPDEAALGNIAARETYIISAETQYVIKNLNNFFETTAFTYNGAQFINPNINQKVILPKVADFKYEFRGLLMGCRELCRQPINVCNLNLEMLLNDVSPNGQYGSIEGIETYNDDSILTKTTDPLSLFNDNNQLLYGGYSTVMETNSETNKLEEIKISHNNWRNPFGGSYKDENGTPSTIRVELVGEGTYKPSLVNDAVINPKDQDPNNDSNVFLVQPKYLQYVSDFVALWQPSWAEALLPYHPEYQYYVYNSALCNKFNGDGNNSDGFDERLANVDYFDSETKVVVDNTIFASNGIISKLLNIDAQTDDSDPFYNSKSSVESDTDYKLRKDLMKEAMNQNFDGLVLQNSKRLNMLKAAYYFAVYSNGLAPQAAYEEFIDKSNSMLLSHINNMSDVNVKQKIWINFRTYYTAFKQKTRTVFSHIYASKNNNYNDCIGNTESSDTFTSIFKKYIVATPNNFERLTTLINTIPQTPQVPDTTPASTGVELACSDVTVALYQNKEKRFIPADFSYDASLSDEQILAEVKKATEVGMYVETGKCPRANDLENFLKGLLDPTIQSQGLLVNGLSTSSMPYLTKELFDAQINASFNLETATQTPKIKATQDASGNLNIGFTYMNNDIATPIQLRFTNSKNDYKNPCGIVVNPPKWEDIIEFKSIYALPGYNITDKTYTFQILAVVKRKNSTTNCMSPEEIIIEGTTRADINGCNDLAVAPCDKKEKFNDAFRSLVFDLQSSKSITSNELNITTNPVFTSGYLYAYFGIKQGDVVKWKNNTNGITITVNDNNRMVIDLSGYTLGRDRISNISIGDLQDNRYNKLRISTKWGFVKVQISGKVTSGNLNNPLYFSCCSSCGEWDHNGDGSGDLCDEKVNICEGYSDEASNYVENLKEGLNEIIANKIFTPQYSFNNPKATKMADFINKSKLIELFQAAKDYYSPSDFTEGYKTPIQLSTFSVEMRDDVNIMDIKFFNSKYECEASILLGGIIKPSSIKRINSINIIDDQSVNIIYTNIDNEIIEVKDVSFGNSIELGPRNITYMDFCQLLSNHGAIPLPPKTNLCSHNPGGETEFEENLKEAFNAIIATNVYNKSQSVASSSTMSNFVAKSDLVKHYQALRDFYVSTHPEIMAEVVEITSFTVSVYANNAGVVINFQNSAAKDVASLSIRLPDYSLISKINFIDIIDKNYATIVYTKKDKQLVTVNDISITNAAMVTKSLGTGSSSFCTFINEEYPRSNNFLKSGTNINSTLIEYPIDEDGLLVINSNELVSGRLLKSTLKSSSFSLQSETTNCNTFCIPPTVAPIICGNKWNEFKTGLNTTVRDYNIPENLIKDASYFCEANFGYISTDYIAYLTKLQIATVQNPLFITIEEFGATKLKYGNPVTPAAINSYASYVSGQKNNKTEELSTWSQYADKYVANNKICAPVIIVPTFSLEIPVVPGSSTETPCELYGNTVKASSKQEIEATFYANKKEEFKQRYLKASLEGLTETLTQSSQDKEYQYTLYYYDQAGNLIQTVPPEGVKRLAPSSDVTIKTVRETIPEKDDLVLVNGISVAPSLTMQTQYRYNSLNQLVWQKTPDGGVTRFAYDALGRIVASQNENQRKAKPLFSYTRYDGLGRITEAGQFEVKTGIALTINDNGRLVFTTNNALVPVDGVMDKYPYNQGVTFDQVTKTIYDVPVADTKEWFTNYGADNCHKRVTAVLYYDQLTTEVTDMKAYDKYSNAILYDYDVHGNVKELIHHTNNNLELNKIKQDRKKVVYDYDLISGNVNKVTYQPDSSKDQFIHRYEYDADNRIQQVYTSKDNIIWEKEANYLYYEHGPLGRVEIGDKKVQGLDYIYTLQGWLKGVNSERIGPLYDVGRDGIDINVAQDAFGFALNYYTGDYQSRFNRKDNLIFSFSKEGKLEQDLNLYNGNIKEMVTSLLDNQQKTIATQFNYYKYDQLNRIKEMTSQSISYNQNLSSNSPISGYHSNYSYDRNGNLDKLNRWAPLSTGVITLMDQLTYNYTAGTNKLSHVNDAVPNGVFTNDSKNPNDTSLDIDNQTADNYGYDDIGQLITDKQEGLKIDWRVDGKVKSVAKDNGTVISFEYDGLGNRTAKIVTNGANVTTTYYQRDAQGNVLSTYELVKQGTTTKYYLVEQDIYGSSRLGVERGRKEITADVVQSILKSGARLSANLNVASPEVKDINVDQYGLNFNTPTTKATWDEKPENNINLFKNGTPRTESITLATHLKIATTNVGTNLLVALHGTHKEGDSWPDNNSYSYLSSVLVSVTKTATGYIPKVSLIKYMREHQNYRNKSGNGRLRYNNYEYMADYEIIATAIPEDEWDLKVVINQNSSSDVYDVSITINGNVYETKPTLSMGANGRKDDQDYAMRSGEKDLLEIRSPKNSIGATAITHRPTQTKTYNGLLAEVCDFSYRVDNGQELEDIETNYF